MSTISLPVMRDYLSKSISSLNRNKLNGLLAEVELRNHLSNLGFLDKISVGGWIVRSVGPGQFGHKIAAFFPETIKPLQPYPSTSSRNYSLPDQGLHTICSTLHQSGIKSYYCTPSVGISDDSDSIEWHATQLGLPRQQAYEQFPDIIQGFNPRTRRHSFLRYSTDVTPIPDNYVAEEFTKEHVRIAFQNKYMCEISDIDGIFWGNQLTYPVEIKEKTAASDSKLGEYFGLDTGPFVKLAFYVAMRGSLSSLFVVREIGDVQSRELVKWWYITFEKLSRFASWISGGGGRNMLGGPSSVVKIPKAEFSELTYDNIARL